MSTLDLEELRARTQSSTAGAQGVRGASADELAALLDMIEHRHDEECKPLTDFEELEEQHADCTPAPNPLRLSLAELWDVVARKRADRLLFLPPDFDSSTQRALRIRDHLRESASAV